MTSEAEILQGLHELKNEIIALKSMIGEQKEHSPKSGKWLSNPEACEYLGICQSTLWGYRKGGVIRAHRIGRKLYFDQVELDNLIAGKRT